MLQSDWTAKFLQWYKSWYSDVTQPPAFPHGGWAIIASRIEVLWSSTVQLGSIWKWLCACVVTMWLLCHMSVIIAYDLFCSIGSDVYCTKNCS